MTMQIHQFITLSALPAIVEQIGVVETTIQESWVVTLNRGVFKGPSLPLYLQGT